MDIQAVIDNHMSSFRSLQEPFRGGIGQYDRLSEQISQRQLRGRMEARAQEHDRVMRNAFDAADFQRWLMSYQ